MYPTFLSVIVVMYVIVVFKFAFEFVIFLNFYLYLNVDAAPIFPERPENFCDPKDPLLLPMISTTVLITPLLWIMFYFLSPW